MQLASCRSCSQTSLRGGRAFSRLRPAAAATSNLSTSASSHHLKIRDAAQPLLSATAAFLVASALMAAAPLSASAVGLESIQLPDAPDLGAAWAGIADGQKQKLADADAAFAKSDTLKRLLEQSEANKGKNKKQIQDKYCYRQAELGIGDCGGLRFIPGMTQNGQQKTPQWLADLLGVKIPEQSPELEGKTLKDLFGGQDLQ